MSGTGKRFLDAGYTKPKPLLCVDGKPIIEHVIGLFPGDHDFLFICNREHIDQTNMREILLSLKPNAKIVEMDYCKKGPVHAVSLAFDLIKDEEDVMVSYCDYGMEWDFEKFVIRTKEENFDGAVPCYTGFHPHLLRKNVYAGVRVDDKNTMLEIQEKHCFTDDPEQSHHSAGAYYFSRGKELKKYFKELMDHDMHLNGEFYVSMVYYLYLRDGLKVVVPELRTFMQWGTPEDLEEYEAWSRHLSEKRGRIKLPTDIPTEREEQVQIPYDQNTRAYLESMRYWSDYFYRT